MTRSEFLAGVVERFANVLQKAERVVEARQRMIENSAPEFAEAYAQAINDRVAAADEYHAFVFDAIETSYSEALNSIAPPMNGREPKAINQEPRL